MSAIGCSSKGYRSGTAPAVDLQLPHIIYYIFKSLHVEVIGKQGNLSAADDSDISLEHNYSQISL